MATVADTRMKSVSPRTHDVLWRQVVAEWVAKATRAPSGTTRDLDGSPPDADGRRSKGQAAERSAPPAGDTKANLFRFHPERETIPDAGAGSQE